MRLIVAGTELRKDHAWSGPYSEKSLGDVDSGATVRHSIGSVIRCRENRPVWQRSQRRKNETSTTVSGFRTGKCPVAEG